MNRQTRWLMLLALSLVSTLAQAGTRHYYYTDPQGTPLAKTDASGNIIASYEYTPYGVPVTSMGVAPDGVGYTGHVNDPETGLVYMQARYYDAEVGRFLSVDPVGVIPGELFNFNRSAYASNNPIMRLDPSGMEDKEPCSAACQKMRKLSDWFSSIGRSLNNSLGEKSGTGPMAQADVMNSYIVASASEDAADGASQAAPIADAVPGATLVACSTGESCDGGTWLMAVVAALPGEGAGADAVKGAYPSIIAGVHGNSAASLLRSYLYRLTNISGDLLKWGISKNPGRRYTQGFMQGKNMQIMTYGSRREMLNLERWIVEHDHGPLNRERWAGKQVGEVP